MNASEFAAYEQAQRVLIQSAGDERDVWTRVRERKKARQCEAAPEPDTRTQAQQSLGPSSTNEEEELIGHLTPEEAISFGEVRRCASQAARAKAHLLAAAGGKLLAFEAAARWSLRCGSYFYAVLAPAPTWEFRSSDSNRCNRCNEELRWGFGPLPFKSFHPDRLGCCCHCSALGVPEKAPKGDKTSLKTRSCGPPQASQTEAIPA